MILKRLRLSFARRIRWTPLLLSACFTVCPGTFAEAQDLPVMDGLLLWLDATDSSTLFQDDALTVPALAGDPIGGWFDKSGNEFHATQPLDEARPTYDMTGISGLPAVSLSGSEASGMFISDDLQLLRPYTVFIVNQYDGPIHGRTLQSQDINWLHGLWGGNPAHYAEGWVSINRLAEDGVVYVEDATGQPGGDSTFFINGIDRTVSSAPAGEPGRLGLASVGMFPGEVSDADVAEIVIYDRVLDDSQLSTMREFFYDKYTVTRLDETIESPLNTVLSGEIGAFTGGDPDDGLDFSGNFVYAFDVGGPGGTSVGDANFEDGSELGLDPGTGVFITDANEIDAWHVPEYGDSVDDDALEFVMQSIRWNTPPGLEIDLPVEDGLYQLQLMFAENCCERGFDISVEG
ncbi:MAG: hypothetical protein KDB23_30835, partial [Planctomycetales bacterium]|nr:hypothetical protein [Planctomycetales bacterium]